MPGHAHMSFIRITPEELALAHEQGSGRIEAWMAEILGRDDPPPVTDLGEAWTGLNHLIGEGAPEYLDLMEDGVWLIDSYGGTLINALDVATVREAAECYRRMPFADLEAHYDAAEMTGPWDDPYPWGVDRDADLAFMRVRYERLVGFFLDAAASGHAALMWCRPVPSG